MEASAASATRQAADGDGRPRAPHAEVDAPRVVGEHSPIAVGEERPLGVVVDDRRLVAGGGTQADTREREVPLLCLDERDERLQARVATDGGGRPADRQPRADQRAVCPGQNLRHQALPGLRQAVRRELHLRHADQSLRTGRTFRPPDVARPAGADAQISSRERAGATERDALGHGRRLPGIPPRRRPGAGVPLSHGELRFARTDQRGMRARHHHPRIWPSWLATWSAIPDKSSGTPPSRTARRANCSMSPS